MDRDTVRSEFPSIEERIRQAHAERSVAMGYAIGEALGALWRVLRTLPFAPSATASPKRPRSRRARSLFAPNE